MKTAEEFKKRLIDLGACEDVSIWSENKTAKEAWEQCERGDWLLWWAQKENTDLRVLTLAKARCTKLVIHLMKDERSVKAVEAAENYGLGLIDLEELDVYFAAASSAYYDSSAAASSAYYAAAAAYSAAYSADYAAAYSAAYSAYSAAYSADYAAIAETLKKCAEIVRENIKPDFL